MLAHRSEHSLIWLIYVTVPHHGSSALSDSSSSSSFSPYLNSVSISFFGISLLTSLLDCAVDGADMGANILLDSPLMTGAKPQCFESSKLMWQLEHCCFLNELVIYGVVGWGGSAVAYGQQARGRECGAERCAGSGKRRGSRWMHALPRRPRGIEPQGHDTRKINRPGILCRITPCRPRHGHK